MLRSACVHVWIFPKDGGTYIDCLELIRRVDILTPIRRTAPKTNKLSDQAYELARKHIIECTLRPGITISEPELSGLIGHSKASVRSALMRLSQEQLVSPLPRQGYRISPLTIRDAQNILDLRLVLEPYAARLAAGKVQRKSLKEVTAFFRKGYDPRVPGSISEFLRINRQFRLTAPRATDNDRLVSAVSGLLDELERYLRFTLAQFHDEMGAAFFERFEELTNALVNGPSELAEELTFRHLQIARDQILRTLIGREEIMGASLV